MNSNMDTLIRPIHQAIAEFLGVLLGLTLTMSAVVFANDIQGGSEEKIAEEAKAVWEDVPGVGKRIVTYTRVNVEQAAYGSPDKTIWVRTLGGVVGKIGQRVEGEAVLVPGERAVLFLKSSPEGHFRVVEMAQGHYPLLKDADVHRLQKSPHLAGVLRGNERAAHEVLVGKAVGEAFDLVRTERKAAGL